MTPPTEHPFYAPEFDGPILECPVFGWFGLTYASYLVLPRLVLQSMPHEWKIRFVEMLEELNASIEGYAAPEYAVFVRDARGRLALEDESVRDYRRGRPFSLRDPQSNARRET